LTVDRISHIDDEQTAERRSSVSAAAVEAALVAIDKGETCYDQLQ